MKRVWLLADGPRAIDPEMRAIRTLLQACGESTETALDAERQPVTVRTARQTYWRSGEHVEHEIYAAVECDGPGVARDVLRIDHHRPGDPGYGVPAERAVAASSLGQVYCELARLGLTSAEYDGYPMTPIGAADRIVRMPRLLAVVAACDHALGAAWAGRVPGITREMVREYRAGLAATRPHEPISREEYLERFTDTLECIRPWPPGVHGIRYIAGYLPELPDVSCYLGWAVESRPKPREGERKKVCLAGATPRQVTAWLEDAQGRGIVDTYGDPERGFAGGYLP